jgi:hypothetical protein
MQSFPINSVKDLEKLSHAVKWQYFEKLVAWIFEQNDFDVKQGVVISTSAGRRQFDMIAKKYGTTWLVECKKWRGKTEKASALKSAVKKHLERCGLYAISNDERTVPIIVTLLDDMTDCENVPIVPIMKLNWFLNNCD